MVILKRAAYVPERGSPEMLEMLAEDPPELLETMLRNVVDSDGEALLQQKLAFDGIGSDGLPALRAALRREGERFLKKSNAILVRHDRDRNARAPGGARTYTGIGIYYFETPVEPVATEKPPARKRRGAGKKESR